MKHFIKYNLIGVLNTLMTLLVIWLLLHLLNTSSLVANFWGFVAGGINSYLWNRIWNFKSKNQKQKEIFRFAAVFIFAYILNVVTLLSAEYALANWNAAQIILSQHSAYLKSGFVANVIANIVYVVVSFGLYKKWVFKKE